jgi:hypothetical protein
MIGSVSAGGKFSVPVASSQFRGFGIGASVLFL